MSSWLAMLVEGGVTYLITPCIVVPRGSALVVFRRASAAEKQYLPADTTYSFHESIGQERLMSWTVGLNGRALLDEAVLPQLGENVLDNLGVLLRRGATIDIKRDREVGVDAFVDFVVLGAKLGGGGLFLEGFGLGRGAILWVHGV